MSRLPLPNLTRSKPPRSDATQAGFTYIGLLIAMAISTLVVGASVQVGSLLQRRAAEEELLHIGLQFRNALQSYANATPAGQKRYPASMQDLLKDPRFPHTVRHLRKLYADPLTGKQEWGIIEPDGGHGILGIYSLATERPIKVGNFDPVWLGFDASDSYQRWRFGVNLNPLQKPPQTSPTPSPNPVKEGDAKLVAEKSPPNTTPPPENALSVAQQARMEREKQREENDTGE